MSARKVSIVLCLLAAASSFSERASAQGGDHMLPEEPASGQSDADSLETVEYASPQSSVSADVAVGGGIGARAISIPSRRSDRRLSTGLFPSAQVGLHGEVALRHLLLGAAATYNTALGLRAASIMPASGDSVDGAQLRSNSLTLGLVPGYRFESVALRVFVGWAFRSLHTVVDLETPSYSLHGPTLRPELTIPLNDGVIVLRLAPELQVIAGASRALVELSNASLPGVALGGEASLQLRLFDGLYAALAYRDSYAMLHTSWGSYVRDSERFVTLQLSLRRH